MECYDLFKLNLLTTKRQLLWLCIVLMPSQLLLGAMTFTNVTEAASILHTHSHADISAFKNSEHALMSGGAVAEDFNGDGWTDLYVLQGGDSPNLLYINQKDGTFADEAADRGVDLIGPHMGAAAADYDSDGDVDIFISGASSPHFLLINDGSGNFAVDTSQVDLPTSAVTSPSWGDIDNDGLQDLALGVWRAHNMQDTDSYLQVYRNTGSGQLAPYLSLPNDWEFLPHFLDFDRDRKQDLLLVSDFGNTRWFRNYGNGLYLPAGTSDVDNGMGTAIGDIDNDGDLDMFITSVGSYNALTEIWSPTGNRLLLNDGAGGFTDITDAAGVRDSAWAWGAEMADFDNDGDLDIYHVNGWPRSSLEYKDTPSRLFENMGDNTFEEIAIASGDAGDFGQGRTVIAFDYDNDGDQDLFIANNCIPEGPGEIGEPFAYNPAPAVLLRNDTVNTHNFLNVKLEGKSAPHHSHGLGGRVYLTIGEVTQMRELHASSGYLGHGPRRFAHFGLNTVSSVDTIRTVWTNGDETEHRDVAVNQSITVQSPKAIVSSRTISPGESVTATFPEENLPQGATATWIVDGVEYGNPASPTLQEPGEHSLVVTISTGEGSAGFVWSETLVVTVGENESDTRSIARIWNEQNLNAIRIDFPDPTTHARNLLASSIAMWDAWAAYDSTAVAYLDNTPATAGDIETARHEAISYAAFRVLMNRYSSSVNASVTRIALTQQMIELGYDPLITTTEGDSAAALGNRIAERVIAFTENDGWDDVSGFMGEIYSAINEPLPVEGSGTQMIDPNRWQPLQFEEAFTQNQQTTDLIQEFLGPNWGGVRPFALASLEAGDLLHLDPGPPPQFGGDSDQDFKDGNLTVIEFSSLLDPDNGAIVDISPSAIGNNTLGFNDGTGFAENPETGQPYPENLVNLADFGRILAEFWADGPDSETPPGHWNTLANELQEHPQFSRSYMGAGPDLDPLEWDVKLYLALNGALHDAAIAAWGCKRVYDYVRPISSIRYMGSLGQSTDPGGPSYHPMGLPLVPNLVDVVTAESTSPGQRHAHLSDHIGEVTIKSWSVGIDEEPGGVGWILAVDWMPYQRATFVTPAFPGYVSGHSTFSRAAAEVLTRMTGSEFFPGGLGTFTAHENEFLEFEEGPTSDVVLQWATYYDAADQAGISRIYGGIHVPADDGPGRIIGSSAGNQAWDLASKYFDGSILDESIDASIQNIDTSGWHLTWNSIRGSYYRIQRANTIQTGNFEYVSDWIWSGESTETVEVPQLPTGTEGEFYRVIRSHKAP
ncbi:MAG: FG-GAP-like repeat-containing protein [Puniceicoccaceae bacterium]